MLALMSQSVLAAEPATKVAESPSMWAMWDVQMAYTYGIGTAETYQSYSKEIANAAFLTVESSFEKKFNVVDSTKLATKTAVTRGQVINELYDIIKLALVNTKVDLKSNAMDYFVSNGLVNGRANKAMLLDKTCTNQEMLVLSKRVYDHVVYTLDLDAKGAFWKVSDGDNTVYLLGSVHVTDGSVYPLNKEIINDFISADALVVEANILVSSPEDTAYIQKLVMLDGTKTIDQLISKETYQKYEAAMKALQVAPEVYNKLKPWYAALLLQNTQLTADSYTGMGIDVYFLSMATGWKPIIELEGARYQLDMFDGFSPALQEEYLASTLAAGDSTTTTGGAITTNSTSSALTTNTTNSAVTTNGAIATTNSAVTTEADTDIVGDILKSWKAGDMTELEKMIFAQEATTASEKELNDKIWTIRNANMVKKIQDMLVKDSEKDYFVVVGAGHMLNDNGIVSELRKLGYTVEQVK